ncbi:hypothetical protein YC2023_041381 [Brassica napus]
MVNKLLYFSELKAGWCRQSVVTRNFHFWESRNVKKGGELMGADLVLVDGKSENKFHIVQSRDIFIDEHAINRTHHNKHKQEDEVRPYGDMEDWEPLDTYADEEDDIDLVEQSISQFLAVHCSAEEHHH